MGPPPVEQFDWAESQAASVWTRPESFPCGRIQITLQPKNEKITANMMLRLDEVPSQQREYCAVCRECVAEVGPEVLQLGCGHRFHTGCIRPRLMNAGACPLCREAPQNVPFSTTSTSSSKEKAATLGSSWTVSFAPSPLAVLDDNRHGVDCRPFETEEPQDKSKNTCMELDMTDHPIDDTADYEFGNIMPESTSPPKSGDFVLGECTQKDHLLPQLSSNYSNHFPVAQSQLTNKISETPCYSEASSSSIPVFGSGQDEIKAPEFSPDFNPVDDPSADNSLPKFPSLQKSYSLDFSLDLDSEESAEAKKGDFATFEDDGDFIARVIEQSEHDEPTPFDLKWCYK
eukprot:jgi/Bigna1/87502/estExt_fgenesh1_pg.C_210054